MASSIYHVMGGNALVNHVILACDHHPHRWTAFFTSRREKIHVQRQKAYYLFFMCNSFAWKEDDGETNIITPLRRLAEETARYGMHLGWSVEARPQILEWSIEAMETSVASLTKRQHIWSICYQLKVYSDLVLWLCISRNLRCLGWKRNWVWKYSKQRP